MAQCTVTCPSSCMSDVHLSCFIPFHLVVSLLTLHVSLMIDLAVWGLLAGARQK